MQLIAGGETMRAASLALLLIVSASPAAAEERSLGGAEIRALLPTIIVRGNGTAQTFSASGETTYSEHGRDSHGRWSVEGDLYCSVWPPNETKACYGIAVEEGPPDGGPATIIWSDPSGERIINIIAAKEAQK
jgi:hypothetical protein